MGNKHGRRRHAAGSGRKTRSVKRRASAIAAVVASLALVVIAATSWRLTSTEHNTGTTETSPYPLDLAVGNAIASSSLTDMLQDDISTALSAREEEQEEKSEGSQSLPLASIAPADLSAIPSGAQLAAFSLFGDAPVLPDDAVSSIEDAIAAIERMGTAGVVFYDASTGKGIAYNADTEVYGASSFKGPYAVYVCQSLIEGGTASLDSPVDVASNNPGSIAIDATSSWASSGASTYPVEDLITAAVIESDNDAYGMLRNQYDNQGYDEWIAGLGVEDAPRDPLSWYPKYCARSSAKLWTNALSYLESESATAAWLSDLFEQTQTSFIRDGIESCEDGKEAVVRNKAGWIADADPAYNAVCDAGIIEAEGRTYVMCIMTSQPDCPEARENVQAMAAALFEARESLQ